MINNSNYHISLDDFFSNNNQHYLPIYKENSQDKNIFLKINSTNFKKFEEYLKSPSLDFKDIQDFFECNEEQPISNESKAEIFHNATRDRHTMKNILFAMKFIL